MQTDNPENGTDQPQYPSQLTADDRDYLHARAVGEISAQVRGYRSVRAGGGMNVDESYARAYVGLPRRAGLLIPLHPLLGGTQRYQLRPYEPRFTPNGKEIKFESQAGLPNTIATSPLTRSDVFNATMPLWIGEGITRVDALAEYGIAAIAINGVYGWLSEGLPLPEWESVPLSGRTMFLAFDGDAEGNPNVNRALARFARWLRAKGDTNTVHILNLPDNLGLDDWIARERPADAPALMAALRPLMAESLTYDPDVGTEGGATHFEHRDRTLPDIHAGIDGSVEQENAIRDALDEANWTLNEPMFNYGGQRAIIRETGQGMMATALTVMSFRNRLSRIANFYRWQKGRRVLCGPPGQVTTAIFDEGPTHERILSGIVPYPVLSRSGDLTDATGYDPETTLYIDCPPLLTMAVEDAVSELDTLFGDFKLEGDHDRAGLYAMMLTPIIRPAVLTAPLMLVTKPQPREGASLMTSLIAHILTGKGFQPIAVADSPRDQDTELRKQLATAILNPDGRLLWRYDNMPSSVDSTSLAELLTDSTWSTRVLGSNQNATLPTAGATIYATVNALVISEELMLRCYETRLNSGDPNPSRRQRFRYPNILRHVQENRVWYLSAVVALVRHWLASGAESNPPAGLGGFEDWTRVVSGILDAAGIGGFMSNMDRLHARASAVDGIQTFVEAWWERHQSNPVLTAQLWDCAHDDGEAIMHINGSDERKQRQSFGALVKRLVDRPFRVGDDVVVSVQSAGKYGSKTQYHLRLGSVS